jgi:hypothetical protein
VLDAFLVVDETAAWNANGDEVGGREETCEGYTESSADDEHTAHTGSINEGGKQEASLLRSPSCFSTCERHYLTKSYLQLSSLPSRSILRLCRRVVLASLQIHLCDDRPNWSLY